MQGQRSENTFGAQHDDLDLTGKLLDALQEIARTQFQRQRADHTLQPTALVNELWLKILRSETAPPTEMVAFRAWAATAIRNILISHARSKMAGKRGGDRVQVQLDPSIESTALSGIDILELEEELQLLKKNDACAARIVELRFYGGMTHEQIAEELEISLRHSQRTWATARAWLGMRLKER